MPDPFLSQYYWRKNVSRNLPEQKREQKSNTRINSECRIRLCLDAQSQVRKKCTVLSTVKKTVRETFVKRETPVTCLQRSQTVRYLRRNNTIMNEQDEREGTNTLFFTTCTRVDFNLQVTWKPGGIVKLKWLPVLSVCFDLFYIGTVYDLLTSPVGECAYLGMCKRVRDWCESTQAPTYNNTNGVDQQHFSICLFY